MGLFPKVEIKRFGGSHAFIFTESGSLIIFKIRADHERAFNTDLGRFQVKKEHRYSLGRGDVYFYDQKSCNPLDVMAVQDLRALAKSIRKDTLPPGYVAVLSGRAAFPEYLPTKMEGEGKDAYPVLDGEKIAALIDATVRNDDEIIEPEKHKITKNTVNWLANYYHEDVQVHLATIGKLLSSMRFRLKMSRKTIGMFSMSLYRKDHIALVVINNRMLDVVPAKLELDASANQYYVWTKKYGKVEINESKTRYKYGKSNVYIVSVKTVSAQPKEKKALKLPQLNIRRAKHV